MSWTQLSAQSLDTTRYCLPIWKARALVNRAIRVPILDSLVEAQQKELNLLYKQVSLNNELLLLREDVIKKQTLVAQDYQSLYENQVKLTQIQKAGKKQWVGVSIVLSILAIIQVFY